MTRTVRTTRMARTAAAITSFDKQLPYSASTGFQAFMLKINWTNAKVVYLTTKQAMTLHGEHVSIEHGVYRTLTADAKLELEAKTRVALTRSAHREGYYYVTIVTAQSNFRCSCPRRFRGCHHIEDMIDYLVARESRRQADEAQECAQQETECERALARARQESVATLAKIEAETEAVIAAELAAQPAQPTSEQYRLVEALEAPHPAPVHGGHCNDIAALAQRQMDAIYRRQQRQQAQHPATTATTATIVDITSRLSVAGLMR